VRSSDESCDAPDRDVGAVYVGHVDLVSDGIDGQGEGERPRGHRVGRVGRAVNHRDGVAAQVGHVDFVGRRVDGEGLGSAPGADRGGHGLRWHWHGCKREHQYESEIAHVNLRYRTKSSASPTAGVIDWFIPQQHGPFLFGARHQRPKQFPGELIWSGVQPRNSSCPSKISTSDLAPTVSGLSASAHRAAMDFFSKASFTWGAMFGLAAIRFSPFQSGVRIRNTRR